MISGKGQHTPLRRIFESSVISAGVGVFIVAFITAIFLDYSSFRSERSRQHHTIHRTLAEFISPYLSISDTTEIRRMLRVVAKEGDVVGLITAESDIILSDYNYSDLFQRLAGQILPFRGKPLDCSKIQIKTLKIENQEYGVYCSELTADTNGSGVKKISALMLSVFSYKFDRFIPHLFEYFLGIALVTLLILSFWIRRMLGHRVLRPMISLRDAIHKKAADPLGGEAALDPIGVSPLEVNQIKEAFEQLILNFRTEYQKRHLAHQKAALVDQATQIAHDIRSPLAALDLVVPSLQRLPEEERIMVRSAISRINDIANNLLAQNRKPVLDSL